MPLLGREADGAVAVGWVLEGREQRLDLRGRGDADAFGWSGVDGCSHGTEPVVEEELHESPAGRVTDQDGRRLELADDRLEMLDDRRHR